MIQTRKFCVNETNIVISDRKICLPCSTSLRRIEGLFQNTRENNSLRNEVFYILIVTTLLCNMAD